MVSREAGEARVPFRNFAPQGQFNVPIVVILSLKLRTALSSPRISRCAMPAWESFDDKSPGHELAFPM